MEIILLGHPDQLLMYLKQVLCYPSFKTVVELNIAILVFLIVMLPSVAVLTIASNEHVSMFRVYLLWCRDSWLV